MDVMGTVTRSVNRVRSHMHLTRCGVMVRGYQMPVLIERTSASKGLLVSLNYCIVYICILTFFVSVGMQVGTFFPCYLYQVHLLKVWSQECILMTPF